MSLPPHIVMHLHYIKRVTQFASLDILPQSSLTIWCNICHLFLLFFLQGHNIFANLSSKEYSNMMQLLKQAILSTDLTLYFK